jgi:putative glutamine transport system substrate-binding protein
MNPETGELEGFEIDLARHIAEALCGNPNAVAFTIVTTPLRGPLLDNGEVDVVIAAYSITEERKQHYNLTRPYYTDEVGFLVRKDAGIRGLADMEQKIIGVIRGTTTAAAVAGEAEKLGLQVRFWDFPSNPPAIAALLDREIDAFSVDKSILLGYQQEETLILSDGFDPQYYGIALQREQDQLTAYIDGLLLAMYEDGTLSALLRKWGL